MIKLNNISKNFGQKEVLKDISCEFKLGKTYALLGRNGVGKTTLLKIIARKSIATSGEIINDFITDGKFSVSCHFDPIEVRYHAGFLGTVKQLYAEYAQYLPNLDMKYVEELSNKFGIDINKKLKLTNAQKSLLTVIITLASNQDVLIFDEPVQLLSSDLRDLFYKELIKVISNEDKLVFLSTHIINEIQNIVTDVLILKKTELVVQSDIESLMEKHDNISLEDIFVKEVL